VTESDGIILTGMTTKEELAKTGMDPSIIERAAALTEAESKVMAAPGTLGLPALLEAKRQRYRITDGAFRVQPVFDRILVWQISEHEGETFGGGGIIMPETVKKRERVETPRGIIVSAGLLALDHLRSNGIDLGHTVYFIQNAPWRIRCDVVGGHMFHVMVLRDGDLIGSVELRSAITTGKIEVTLRESQHILTDKAGNVLGTPQLPWIADDY
jgi:co-chaperonin GroES (HSP10)